MSQVSVLSPVLSATATSAKATAIADCDRAVEAVKARARSFARLSAQAKANLLKEVIPRLQSISPAWVEAGCRAKGIDPRASVAGEEWLGGPAITMRNVRLLVDSLEQIARSGRPQLGSGVTTRADQRVEVKVFPNSKLDAAMFGGFSARMLMQEGVSATAVRERQASFYQQHDPEGALTVVLGAGNVASIPATDVLYKMFNDGNVCVLKVNPVNEWVGPFIEHAFEPLTSRDYVRVTYGAGDVGAHLCEHPLVDDIHITGSDRTHDLIVWGPPGPDRDRRVAANDPKLKKTITSELGNVSPVAIVPAAYSDAELWFQARSLASMIGNNGSFNCNAAKMLITAKGWGQRDTFLALVARALGQVPTRKAYYPGAFDRYKELTAGRNVERFGQATDDKLAWTIIRDVDSAKKDDKLFRMEPFCGILSHTEIASNDPAAFLGELTSFANDTLWGTLNACIVIHPRHEADPQIGKALDKALVELRYGTVGINHWPAVGYGLVNPAWGGHPSATLTNIQSGLGWVHNTFMFEGIDKSIIRGPLVAKPKPAWFYDNRKVHLIGEKMVAMYAAPSWWKLPGLVVNALSG
jgi:acyl-CoA reductase-like NAD-dependent aldehyde dehydrogenase